jgi:hypothetical protein
MNLDKEISRGFEAERLMNEPLLKEAFSAVEADILTAMKRASIGDEKSHHELVLLYQMLEKIKGSLHTVMETGKLAQIQKESLLQKGKKLFRAA